MKRTVRLRAKRDNNFVEIRIACGACGSQSETETQDGFICICFSYFFISGHSFIFSFVSTSLTYITIPRNKGKLKITCDKKLTTTYFSFKTSRRFWLAKSTPAWSYENRVSKHLVIFLNFPCLIACLLCCLLMSFVCLFAFFLLVLWLGICVEVDVDRITILPPLTCCTFDVIGSLNAKIFQIWSSVAGYGELCVYTWIFENRVSKNINWFYYLAI